MMLKELTPWSPNTLISLCNIISIFEHRTGVRREVVIKALSPTFILDRSLKLSRSFLAKWGLEPLITWGNF